jgi:hypothetical protein
MAAATIELRHRGKALGPFTRGELVDLHAQIGCILEVELESAQAWLALTRQQRERVARIVEVVIEECCESFTLGGNAGKARRIACGLVREFEPDMPALVLAAALRVTVETVESNARWLASLDQRTGEKNEFLREWLNWLRARVKEALKQPCKAR